MQRWRIALVLLLCATLAVALPTAALAQEVPRLQQQITDLTQQQVLAGDRGRIDAALAELLQRHNVQLFVLFVETAGGRSVTQFADEVARLNSLGANDALLVVALSDRTDALWRGSQSLERLTDAELEEVLSRRVEPRLAQGNFAGAVVAAAEGVGNAAAPAGPGVSLDFGVLLIVLIVVVLGGFWLWSAVANSRRDRKLAEQRLRQLERRAHEADALLIEADEAVRDAQVEIRFAEAQFTESEVAPFREALASANEELQAAFAVRQKFEDDIPEDQNTRQQMVEEIVERAKRAQSLLEEQQKAFEQLRDLERRAPEILAELPEEIEKLEARLPEGERTLAGFERYSERSWAAVKENVGAARERLVEARTALEQGRQSLDAGDRLAAGRSARLAQQAAVKADELLDGIGHLAEALRQAEQNVGRQLADAAADLRAAGAALPDRASGSLRGRLAQGQAALEASERELATERPDFLAASRLATEADTIADQILAEVRQEEERRTRETRILAAQLQAAEASYFRAADYISARRHSVGGAARTRLAEARRNLERARALADDDPTEALAAARRAQDLAEAAYALARDDTDSSDGWGGGRRRPSTVIFPVPFPFPTGGGWGGGRGVGGGWGGGRSVGGGWGGGSVGGRW